MPPNAPASPPSSTVLRSAAAALDARDLGNLRSAVHGGLCTGLHTPPEDRASYARLKRAGYLAEDTSSRWGGEYVATQAGRDRIAAEDAADATIAMARATRVA